MKKLKENSLFGKKNFNRNLFIDKSKKTPISKEKWIDKVIKNPNNPFKNKA